MFLKKNILTIIPARGGSKGVPLKNIHLLGGRPLIDWTLDCILEMGKKTRTIVSTDSHKIAEVVKNRGIEVPFLRPSALSGDNAKDFEVIEHALLQSEIIDNKKYDIILMLQPTSPFRTVKQLLRVLKHLINNELDCVWTVSATDQKYHPIKQMYIKDGLLNYVMEEGKSLPTRQTLKPTYHVNGLAYAFTRDCILKQRKRMGLKTAPLIIKEKVVNIDTMDDFYYAEKHLEAFLNKETF
jgi:CMP-N,N'-diacetyllegionaminic acid synthase